MDHRHDLPRRPAGPPALHRRSRSWTSSSSCTSSTAAAGSSAQSEFFLYSKKDREAVEKCRELGYEFPQVTGWIRAVKSDFKLVKEMGLEETGILTSRAATTTSS